jgi:hypothetical protein
MGHNDRPAALHLAFVEYGLECMAPIMFMRRMMRPTFLQRETRANRQRGEKAVERGDTHALVRRCFRLEGKRRDRRFPLQKTVHPKSRPSPPTTLRIGSLRSRHCYRGYVKRARWWVARTKLVPTTCRPRVWTTADQVRPVALEAHSSTAVGPIQNLNPDVLDDGVRRGSVSQRCDRPLCFRRNSGASLSNDKCHRDGFERALRYVVGDHHLGALLREEQRGEVSGNP